MYPRCLLPALLSRRCPRIAPARLALALTLALTLPAAAQVGEAPGASLTAAVNPETIHVTVDVASAAHLRLLERSLRLNSPPRDIRIEPHRDDRLSAEWMLVSELATRIAALLESGEVRASDRSVRIHGTTAEPEAQAALVSRLTAVSGAETAVAYEVTAISAKRLSFEALCRRQFYHLTSGKRLDFANAGATLGSASLPILDGLAELMSDCPQLRVQVTGHTDSAGGEAINRQVSEARANAVVDYLVDLGLPADRFRPVGAGASDPLVPGQDAAANRINRRVEFSLLKELEPLAVTGHRLAGLGEARSGLFLGGNVAVQPSQLHLEQQGRAGRDNVAGTAIPVGHFRRDQELPGFADAHPGDALVPALDDPAGAEREFEVLAADHGAVEFLAPAVHGLGVMKPARVMHRHGLPGGCHVPVALGRDAHLQPGHDFAPGAVGGRLVRGCCRCRFGRGGRRLRFTASAGGQDNQCKREKAESNHGHCCPSNPKSSGMIADDGESPEQVYCESSSEKSSDAELMQ